MSPIEVFSFSPGSWTGGASSQFILISCKVYNSHLLCSYNTMILWVVMVWSSWRVRGQSALHFDKATKKTRLTSSSSSTSHHHNHHYYTNVSIIIRPSPSSSPTGSLSNDDGDVNENGIKATGLDWKNNNFARALRFFVHFFVVSARLRRENALFNVLWRTWTQGNNFLLFFCYDTVFWNSTPQKNCQDLANWMR